MAWAVLDIVAFCTTALLCLTVGLLVLDYLIDFLDGASGEPDTYAP